MSLSYAELGEYVKDQLNFFFPDRHRISVADIGSSLQVALERVEMCFKRSRVGRYCSSGQAKLAHLYSDQYLMFLWFLSNTLWRNGADNSLVHKVYLLNKSLHAFDCAFDTVMPDVFLVIHGVGTVLGKGVYSDGLVVYQGCTVGQAHGDYPKLGYGVGLGAGAALLGRCDIGDHASIGAGCTLVNVTVPPRSSVYRDSSGKLIITTARSGSIASEYFSEDYLRSIPPTTVS